MISKRKAQNLTLLILLSLFLFLIVAAPVSAQLRGGEILKKSIEAAEVSETAMDDMWTELFSSGSLLYNQLVETATIILIIAFPFLMMAFGNAVRDQNAAKTGEIIAWALVIFILLDDSGAMLKQATLGVRTIINREAASLLEVQVADLTIRDAMRDVILFEQKNVKMKLAIAILNVRRKKVRRSLSVLTRLLSMLKRLLLSMKIKHGEAQD